MTTFVEQIIKAERIQEVTYEVNHHEDHEMIIIGEYVYRIFYLGRDGYEVEFDGNDVVASGLKCRDDAMHEVFMSRQALAISGGE